MKVKYMENNDTFFISEDLEAFLERAGANYTGNFIVQSKSLDDYDIYQLDSTGWTFHYDSLSNRCKEARNIWENEPFKQWANKCFAKLKKEL